MVRRTMFTPFMVALLFMVGATSFAEAQTSGIPDCATKLAACVDYLNSTNPPASCCDPLKETVTNQLQCLCNIYNSPGLLESFGVNVSQALDLSHRCGVTTDLSKCTNATAPPPSQTTSQTPPATPGDSGSPGRVAFSGLSLLVLFWASMLLN